LNVIENWMTAPAAAPSKRSSLVVFLLLLLIFVVLNVRMVAPYLLTVLSGGILAVLAYPLYKRLLCARFRPVVASTLVTTGVVVLVIGPLVLFTSLAVREGVRLSHDLSMTGNFSLPALIHPAFAWGPLKTIWGSPALREQQAHNAILALNRGITSLVLGLVAILPSLTLQTILAVIACWFFLMDGGAFVVWLNQKIPLEPEVRIAMLESFHNTAVSTLWSAVAGALVQSSFLVLAFLVTRVPAVFVAGGVAFVMAWVPIVGSIPVWVVGLLYLLFHTPSVFHSALFPALVLVGLGLVAGALDNVVRTIVLKGRGDMHSLVGLIAIFGGIDCFGVFGVFYGPILMAMLLALLDAWPLVGKRFGVFSESPIYSKRGS